MLGKFGSFGSSLVEELLLLGLMVVGSEFEMLLLNLLLDLTLIFLVFR
jgi:hypothetical protein